MLYADAKGLKTVELNPDAVKAKVDVADTG